MKAEDFFPDAKTRDRKLAEFGRRFIELYLRDGLGVMTKKETEILVMSLLESQGDLDKKSNHELSLLLRQSESVITNLRYQARLRYPDTEEAYAERRLLWALVKAEMEPNGKKIRLVIEDKFVRQFLQAKVKSEGVVIDTSFNREIVEVHGEKLADILGKIYGEKFENRWKKEFKKVVDSQHEFTFAEAKKEFFKGLANESGKAIPTVAGAILEAYGWI
jgi:hypothetical protein